MAFKSLYNIFHPHRFVFSLLFSPDMCMCWALNLPCSYMPMGLCTSWSLGYEHPSSFSTKQALAIYYWLRCHFLHANGPSAWFSCSFCVPIELACALLIKLIIWQSDTISIWGQTVLCWGGGVVLCLIGCLVASLGSTYCAKCNLPSCAKECPQILPNFLLTLLPLTTSLNIYLGIWTWSSSQARVRYSGGCGVSGRAPAFWVQIPEFKALSHQKKKKKKKSHSLWS
jgi:hypothetical protein